MRQGGGKAKGSGFEREIGKLLSLWWTKGENKSVFGRSASSGALFTNRKKEGFKHHSGDLIAIDPIGEPLIKKVSIEIKFWKKEDSLLFEMIFSRRGQILQWWQQCETDALDANKLPMLIVKFNHRIPFTIIPVEFYNRIMDKYGCHTSKAVLSGRLNFGDSVFERIVFIKLEEFLRWCQPEFFETFEGLSII